MTTVETDNCVVIDPKIFEQAAKSKSIPVSGITISVIIVIACVITAIQNGMIEVKIVAGLFAIAGIIVIVFGSIEIYNINSARNTIQTTKECPKTLDRW